jgi:hypothetical protein
MDQWIDERADMNTHSNPGRAPRSPQNVFHHTGIAG